MANLVPKVPADVWVATAQEVLVKEGIGAVKVDRLARTLGVSRGGFYHHFADRADLLERLLITWRKRALFVPHGLTPVNPGEALAAIDALVKNLIDEVDYDPLFDLAVRAWARADEKVGIAVKRADRERVQALEQIFDALGCSREEAGIRARVFYFHQIGYYAIGVRESRAIRIGRVHSYINILCGKQYLEAARNAPISRNWSRQCQFNGQVHNQIGL